MAFLPRHGRGHVLGPSQINYRANIDALKRLGVTDVISSDLPVAAFAVDEYLGAAELHPVVAETGLNAEVYQRLQLDRVHHAPDAGAELHAERQLAVAVQLLVDA